MKKKVTVEVRVEGIVMKDCVVEGQHTNEIREKAMEKARRYAKQNCSLLNMKVEILMVEIGF